MTSSTIPMANEASFRAHRRWNICTHVKLRIIDGVLVIEDGGTSENVC